MSRPHIVLPTADLHLLCCKVKAIHVCLVSLLSVKHWILVYVVLVFCHIIFFKCLIFCSVRNMLISFSSFVILFNLYLFYYLNKKVCLWHAHCDAWFLLFHLIWNWCMQFSFSCINHWFQYLKLYVLWSN